MNKVGKFLEEHDLEVELMQNDSFVNDSKEIFEESGLEFSRAQPEEIIGSIDKNLETIKKIPENALKQVVGGVKLTEKNLQKISQAPASKGAIAVEAAMTIAGILVGGAIGLPLSFRHDSTTSTTETKDATGSVTSTSTTKTYSKSLGYAPMMFTAGLGSVVGFQLGKLIARKCNL